MPVDWVAVERLTPQVDALVGYLGWNAVKALPLMGRRPVLGLDYPDTRSVRQHCLPTTSRLALQDLRSTGRARIAFLDADKGGAAAS